MRHIILVIICLLMSHHLPANECGGLDVVTVLDSLSDVGQIYNCKIEVVRLSTSREVSGVETPMVSYLVYGKDEFRCKTTNRICPKANFEISIPEICLNKKTELPQNIQFSSGYNIDGKKLRNHIKIIKSAKQIQFLAFGQTDLDSASRINYVQCQLNIFGE
ncbi:MAG: hypothetical protein KDD37_07305 [Bdellovibrionales bacterium]|nr:hypothetical protein [Bdellovibrionales bacterium]